MRDDPANPGPAKPKPARAPTRADRLKAALKANVGRRKEQAKGRSKDQPKDG